MRRYAEPIGFTRLAQAIEIAGAPAHDGKRPQASEPTLHMQMNEVAALAATPFWRLDRPGPTALPKDLADLFVLLSAYAWAHHRPPVQLLV